MQDWSSDPQLFQINPKKKLYQSICLDFYILCVITL